MPIAIIEKATGNEVDASGNILNTSTRTRTLTVIGGDIIDITDPNNPVVVVRGVENQFQEIGGDIIDITDPGRPKLVVRGSETLKTPESFIPIEEAPPPMNVPDNLGIFSLMDSMDDGLDVPDVPMQRPRTPMPSPRTMFERFQPNPNNFFLNGNLIGNPEDDDPQRDRLIYEAMNQ